MPPLGIETIREWATLVFAAIGAAFPVIRYYFERRATQRAETQGMEKKLSLELGILKQDGACLAEIVFLNSSPHEATFHEVQVIKPYLARLSAAELRGKGHLTVGQYFPLAKPSKSLKLNHVVRPKRRDEFKFFAYPGVNWMGKRHFSMRVRLTISLNSARRSSIRVIIHSQPIVWAASKPESVT